MDRTAISSLVILCLCGAVLIEASTKKGVCGWGGNFLCDDFKRLNNMTWMYDWHNDLSTIYGKHTKQINCPESSYMPYLPEYVPMIFTLSDNPGHQGYLQHPTNVSSNAKFILGFNEPNHKDQANMTPREAADRWPEIERNSNGIPLVSPAPAGHNTQWLDDFFHLCKGCRVDYVAAHSYRCHADDTMTFLKDLYHRHGKKIWLTEFACPGTNDKDVMLNYMKDILPKLEAAHYVFRYSWFSARVKSPHGTVTHGVGSRINPAASLFWPNSNVSSLTPLGHFYNDFQGNGHAANIIG